MSNGLSWWNTDYERSIQLIVEAAADNGISSGYTLNFNPTDADAAEIYNDCLANGDDLRVAYWNGSSWVELDRHLVTFSESEIEVRFAAQAGIAGGESNDDHYLYYSNPGAGSPPEDYDNVYEFFDDFEDGSYDTSKWTFVESGDASAQYTEANGYLDLKKTDFHWASACSFGDGAFGTGHLFEAKVIYYDRSWTYCGVGWGSSQAAKRGFSDGFFMFLYHDNVEIKKKVSGGQTTLVDTGSADPVAVWEFATVGGTLYAWKDGVSQGSWEQSDLGDLYPFLEGGGGNGDNRRSRFEYALVRQYVATEPTVSGGSEEEAPSAVPQPHSFIM